MTESQLKAGKDLQEDRSIVYEQMKSMKARIEECSRKNYKTEDAKEDFDDFKLDLLTQCDDFVESQRRKMDKKFSSI